VLTASISLPHEQYKTNAVTGRFYQQLTADLSELPASKRRCGQRSSLDGWDENAGGFTIEGTKPRRQGISRALSHGDARYFKALGVPLIASLLQRRRHGDLATNHHRESRHGRSLLAGENVIGKRMSFEDNPKEKDWITVW